MKAYGKESLLEDYREIYKDTKGNPEVGTEEDKVTIANIDKCLGKGELFYVSFIHNFLSTLFRTASLWQRMELQRKKYTSWLALICDAKHQKLSEMMECV